MIRNIFDSSTNMILQKSMDAASVRNEVIANNIANVDTPNFKRSEVVFEKKVKELMNSSYKKIDIKVTNPRHLAIRNNTTIKNISPEIIEINDYSYRNDNNNVDIDVEMAKLTKNKIYYDSVTQSMSNEIRLLRMAITGRG